MTNFCCWSFEYSEMESGELTVKYFSKAKLDKDRYLLTRFLEEFHVAFSCRETCDVVLVELRNHLSLVQLLGIFHGLHVAISVRERFRIIDSINRQLDFDVVSNLLN
jgi:hypothetical protein